MPCAAESTWPATTTLPKASPALDPPVHQPTVRTSSGMTSAPSGWSPTGTTGAPLPSGRTTRVGTKTTGRAGSSRPTEALGTPEAPGAAGPPGGAGRGGPPGAGGPAGGAGVGGGGGGGGRGGAGGGGGRGGAPRRPAEPAGRQQTREREDDAVAADENEDDAAARAPP